MAANALARVSNASGVQSWSKAGGKGDKLELLAAGTVIQLLQTRKVADGTRWWGAPVEGLGFTGPAVGWIQEAAANGATNLEPVGPDCPAAAPRTAAELPKESWFRLACFGSSQLELEGSIRCEIGIAELSIQGASWIDGGRWCVLDDALRLNGEPATALLGEQPQGTIQERHVVRGHFDDPESTHCVGTSFGVGIGTNTGPGEPAAAAICRTSFVVDEVLPPTGG